MSVNNKVLKAQANKVWQAIEHKLKNHVENKKGDETKKVEENVLVFLQNLKQKGIYRFRSNSSMAKLLLGLLDEKQTQEYLNFLKKKSNNSEDTREKLFYIHEVFVLCEHSMLRKTTGIDLPLLQQVSGYILEQSSNNKVVKVMEKEWHFKRQQMEEEEKEDEEQEESFSLNLEHYDNVREKIFDAFYSLMQTAQLQAKQVVLDGGKAQHRTAVVL